MKFSSLPVAVASAPPPKWHEMRRDERRKTGRSLRETDHSISYQFEIRRA
jgi:hypothetical protein